MASQESLNAIFRAEDRASGPIEDIGDASEATAASLDLLESMGDAAERTLSSLARTATGAVGPLDATAASTAAVGANASLAAEQVEGLDDALSDVDASGLATVAAQDAATDDQTVSVRTDLDEASASATRTLLETLTRDRTVDIRPSLSTASLALPALGAITPSVAPDMEAAMGSVDTDALTGGLAAPAMPAPDLSALSFDTATPESVSPDVDATQLSAGAGAAHAYAEGLDAVAPSAAQASAMNALLDREAEAAGDSLLGAVPGGEALEGTLDGVRNAAVTAVPGLARFEDQAEEAGDTSGRSAAQVGALSGAMAGGVGPTDRLGGSMFGLHGSLSALAVVLPGVIALLGGLVGPLGAAATAATGAGAAFAGLFAGGMLQQAEQLVGTTQEVGGEMTAIEDKGQAIQALFGDIKDRAAEIAEPLQTAQTGQFFQGIVDAGLETFRDFVTMTTSLMGPLFDVADRIGAVFERQRPEFFAELEKTVRRVLPALESFAEWSLRAIPDALRWMREEGAQTAGALIELAGAALSLGVELAEIGGVIWSVLGPGLTVLLDTLTAVADIFTDLPGPLQTFLAASAVAYPILTSLAAGIAAVSAAGGVLAVVMGAISWPILAVAAAIGAAVAIMTEWDTIVNMLGQSWNWLVGVVEGAVNGILSSIGGMVNTGIGWINGLIDTINKIPGADIEKAGKVDLGSADLSGLNVGTASTDDSGGGSGSGSGGGGGGLLGGGGAGAGGAGAQPTEKYEQNITVDARGSDANASDMRHHVQRALDVDRLRRRKRTGPTG